jgi:hypothetical protein
MLSKAARPDNSGKSRLAGKKIIIYLTIASLLNLVGCYYQQQISPEEYNFDENLNLQVTTKDTTYSLNANDYYYDKDTLYVKSLKVVDKNHYKVQYKLTTKIPVKDIEKLEIEKTDVTATIGIVAGVVVIIAGIIVTLAIADYSGHL